MIDIESFCEERLLIIDGVLDAVSVAFAWQWKNLLITVSIAGPIGAVHGLLCELPSIVTPSSPSSAWIEALEKAISDRSPKGQPLCNPIRFLPNLDILLLPHPTGPEYQFRMRLPLADGENRSSVA